MKLLFGLLAAGMLIFDSQTAAVCARNALELCGKTLIPGLFPLFVLCGLLVPQLAGFRLGGLSRLLGLPGGSEGIFLLGCAGGFPLGAACIAQGVENGGLSRTDGERMLGLCSLCGPGFLMGVVGNLLSLRPAAVLFCIQLETALLLGAIWPGPSRRTYRGTGSTVALPQAVQKAIGSMGSVCAWVLLAAVAAGLLKKRLFPCLPESVGLLLTGLLELTNGVFSLGGLSEELQFLFCTVFVCFGGVSVLLQIGGFAAGAGLSMKQCILQKAAQAMLGALLAGGYLAFGGLVLLLPPVLLAAKIPVAFSGKMVYNVGRKEGM